MSGRIPTISDCLKYHDRFEMFENIRTHSLVVAQVAETLVDGLNSSGKSPGPLPDKKEVLAGALLHDIAKTLCIKTDCRHAEMGRQICLDLGYPEISKIVAEHVVLRDFRPELYKKGIFGAKEMVFYADKRVRHDQVVSIADRLDYILMQYGDNNLTKEALIRQNFSKTLDFEAYLFAYLDFQPQDISRFISPLDYTTK